MIIGFTWVLSISGTTSISFLDYQLSLGLGFFIIGLVLIFWMLSIVGRVISLLIHVPQTFLGHNETSFHKKGLQSLAYGLSAVAAGDIRMAQYYSNRTNRFLKNDFGLADLLTGLTARLTNDDKQTAKSFSKLMTHPETSILGLKALLNTAIEKNDFRYARILADRAYSQHPKNPWVIKQLYLMTLRNGDYDASFVLLDRLKRYSDIDKKSYKHDKAAIFMARGDTEKSFKQNPDFLPAVLEIIKIWIADGKIRKSTNLIKKTWADTPHPKLLDYWIQCAPKKAIKDTYAMLSWIENLHSYNANNAAGTLYTAECLLRLNQNNKSQELLKKSMSSTPTIRCAQLMHQLDPQGGWMDNFTSLRQNQTWICSITKQTYQTWKPVNNDGHFNSIIWDYPQSITKQIHNYRPFSLV